MESFFDPFIQEICTFAYDVNSCPSNLNFNILYYSSFSSLNSDINTNPEEWRVALSIEAHCKVVWLRPQDLHNVLIELGLFFLQRATKEETEGAFRGELQM